MIADDELIIYIYIYTVYLSLFLYMQVFISPYRSDADEVSRAM